MDQITQPPAPSQTTPPQASSPTPPQSPPQPVQGQPPSGVLVNEDPAAPDEAAIHARRMVWIRRGLAIFVGVLIGVPFVLYAFFLVQGAFTQASDTVPRDVVIQDITENSATVLWTTDQESQGTILYGTEQTAMTSLAPDMTTSRDHTVTITNLEPGTTYYFSIQIGGDRYLNGGIPWFFTTEGGAAAEGLGSDSPPRQECPQTTDCTQIQELLGRGCSTAEYLICIRAQEDSL